MKSFTMLIPILFAAFACNNNHVTAQSSLKTKTPVVIELFTSEGCSSCPAAEKYLGSLSKADSNIILLSFHVDYWNRLGWVDSFSNHDFSQRQYDYSNRFNLSSVYTPQAVINGTKETTGSNANKIQQYIQQTNAPVNNSIGAISIITEKDKLLVSANNYVKNENELYEIFLVQKQVTTHIMAGENEGASLEHNNVVRSFVTTETPVNTSLSWKTTYAKNNFKVVIVARDKKTLAVKDVVAKSL